MKKHDSTITKPFNPDDGEFIVNGKCFYPALLSFPFLKDLSLLLVKKLMPETGFITVRIVKTHYEKGLSFEFTNFCLEKQEFTKPYSHIYTVDIKPSWQVASCFSHWHVRSSETEQYEELVELVDTMQIEVWNFMEVVRYHYQYTGEDPIVGQYLQDRSWHTIFID